MPIETEGGLVSLHYFVEGFMLFRIELGVYIDDSLSLSDG